MLLPIQTVLTWTLWNTSTYLSLAGRLPAFQPLLERRLALAGGPAGQQAFDVEILIEILPVNTLPFADQPPVIAFFLGGMYQPGEPGQWHGDRPAITQTDAQGIFGYGQGSGAGDFDFNFGVRPRRFQ